MALRPPVARNDVAHGVVADMPHVDAPRRIGKHLKHIGAGLCRAVVCDEGAVFFPHALPAGVGSRSEEHTSELQSLMRISYAVFCLKKKNNRTKNKNS